MTQVENVAADHIAGADKMVPVAGETTQADDSLWCLHALGFDEVHPAPDRATAQLWAAQWTVWNQRRNPTPDGLEPVVSWTVARWPHDADSHAKGLARSVAGNTFPVDPLTASTPPVPDVAAIPVGMKPWYGGHEAPHDYGGTVRFRDGETDAHEDGIVFDWRWACAPKDDDIIAYTPKPAPVATGSGDALPKPLGAYVGVTSASNRKYPEAAEVAGEAFTFLPINKPIDIAALSATHPTTATDDDAAAVRAMSTAIVQHFESVERHPSTGELDPPLADDDAVSIPVGKLRDLRAALTPTTAANANPCCGEHIAGSRCPACPDRVRTTAADTGSTEGVERLVAIEGDQIVIRVPIHALPDAAATAFDRHYGFDVRSASVVDPNAFARDLLDELLREDDNGDTPVTRMLDATCVKAEQAGAEGLAR